MNFDIEKFNTKLTTAERSAYAEPRTVFVPNRSGHNYSSAEKYGSLEYITSGEINRFEVGRMARRWMKALVRSSPEDYVLLTSLTILTVIGAAIFGYLHGRINVLIYRNEKYIARTIIFSELKEAVEQGLEEEKETLL